MDDLLIGSGSEGWPGPYLKEAISDPWGNEFMPVALHMTGRGVDATMTVSEGRDDLAFVRKESIP